ncbi:GNAT family N-acetyltransferase [Chloroflexi bacterium TSY]|nr:GNAT family N-acetyltransferase [Chloroflexi bacterium TSY]
MKTLETERLIIRPFTMDDLTDAHLLLDQDIQWAGPDFPIAKRRERLQRDIYLAEWDDVGNLYGYRAIVLKEINAIIGFCGFLPGYYSPEMQALFLPQLFGEEKGKPSKYAIDALEIGYALASHHRGRGYATEAIKEILRYAFRILKVERVYASTNRSNRGSIELMKRVGMRTASNPQHPELDWPNGPGVLGGISRSKFGVFGYFQSRLQGFWSHLFRFRLQKTTYFISENRPNLTQKLDIDRQICIYVNCLARILSQNLKFGSTGYRK